MTNSVAITLVPERHLVEVTDEHPLLAAQLAHAAERAALLSRAAFSGRRGPSALRSVLARHEGVPAATVDGLVYLACCTCRDPGQPIVGEFSCPTERDAYWGLHALLGAPGEA
ncbi:MAG: hypothetical protein MUC45_02310 [Actinomycetia bacterium]|jgi:hypothetical protein|nr:hypothetical protein [Actinomycetes bacterium]